VCPQCLLVSPFRGEEKHPANPLAISQRFLNFGALSLASYLVRSGFSSLVLDEYSQPPDRELIGDLSSRFEDQSPIIVGVSSISSYSAGRTQQLLTELSNLWPDVPKVIGGQHFVGYWGKEFAKHIPEADMLVAGEAEAAMLEIMKVFESGKNLESLVPSDLPANVYWKCRDAVASIAAAVGKLVESRDERPLQFYMQASNFSVTRKEAKSLELSLEKFSKFAHWRTEIRVDGVENGTMKSLANAGLRVLDLGLESASPRILKLMHKTKNPDRYLADAKQVLSEATDAGIFTKVNFLIHPGDTPDSVNESWSWLKSHSDVISGVSSGVTLEYPGTPLSKDLARYKAKFGTERQEHPLSNWGVFYLKPSNSLSHSSAESLAASIAQSMQTRADFARSKSFGYLSADSTPEEILASLPEASHETPYRK